MIDGITNFKLLIYFEFFSTTPIDHSLIRVGNLTIIDGINNIKVLVHF